MMMKENIADELKSKTTDSTPEQKSSKKSPQKLSPQVSALKEELDALKTPEEKIRGALENMRTGLTQKGAVNFRAFWQVKRLCIEYFKESVHPAVRSQLWQQYCELSDEARKLQVLMEKESDFAAEQIDLAIQSLEEEVNRAQELITTCEAVTLSMPSKIIEAHLGEYSVIQNELTLLGKWASRINSLRKELIATGMRMGKKAKFFKRLSSVGDRVFPRRKELISALSERFIKDVEDFAETQFSDKPSTPYYELREEIKALQSAAKAYTLNTAAFVRSRELLSKCWDRVRECETERRQTRAQQDAVFDQHVGEIKERVSRLLETGEGDPIVKKKLIQEADEMDKQLRAAKVGKHHWQLGQKEISKIRALIEKVEGEDRQKEAAARCSRIEKSRDERHQFEEKIAELIGSTNDVTLDVLSEQQQKLIVSIQECRMLKDDKKSLSSHLKRLDDVIRRAQEEVVIRSAQEEGGDKVQLRAILQQRTQERQQIKARVEQLRKAKGGSGLDFEAALTVEEDLSREKARLAELDSAIADLQLKV